MNRRRDTLNIISQMVVKFVLIPYGLLVVALATRRLPQHEAYLLLEAGSFIALPGLLQLGMGYLILRDVSNAWARDGHFDNLPIVRAGFWMIFAVTSMTLVISFAASSRGWLPGALIPLIVISLLGQWAVVADYVRLAKGEVLKTNILILAGILACGLIVWWTLASDRPSIAVVIFGALAVPFLGSLASFALLLRDEQFRQMLSPWGQFEFRVLVAQSVPMFLNTAAFSLMLVIPLSAPVVPWFPELPIETLACLRLTTSVIFLYYFALQPLGPIFLRAWHGRTPEGLRKMSARLMSALLGLCVAGGVVFSLATPPFVDIWLAGVTVRTALAAEWGLILALSLITMTTVYFCQNTSRPILAAACLIVADTVMVLAPLSGLDVEGSMILALVCGCAIGLMSLARAVLQQMSLLGAQLRLDDDSGRAGEI